MALALDVVKLRLGMFYVGSGYAVGNATAGNWLLAFEVARTD